MTDQEETDLIAQGQAIADQQMLETLLTLNEADRPYFDYVAAHYSGLPLDEFVQMWRDVYEA